MMKFDYGLSAALTGISIAFIQPQVAVALSSIEVGKIATQITVRIEGNNSLGSGVMIKHSGDTYTVLTCKHVVEKPDKFTIFTPDGKPYPLDYSKAKKLQLGLDLAVVQFNSKKTYTIAKISNSDKATLGTVSFVAGFPEPTGAIPDSIFRFVKGDITANASKALDGGYALVYSNNTSSGMSGGPVLNENGEVVGVHGRAETAVDKDNRAIDTGFNLGIPINTFVTLSSSVGVDLGISVPSPRPTTTATADNLYIQAGDKFKKRDFQGAIAAFNQAIQLKPDYARAYYGRGAAHSMLNDYRGAIRDYTQAISLDPNYARAYALRGVARSIEEDDQGAIEDINQSLRLDPSFTLIYYFRGRSRFERRDYQGAIEDFNQALRLDRNDLDAYYFRAQARFSLRDYQGAIEDINQFIRLDPINTRQAYLLRGTANAMLIYSQDAIRDLNQAIRLDPTDAFAYRFRGAAYFQLGDKQGAFADLQRAADLAQQQGDSTLYQTIQKDIRERGL